MPILDKLSAMNRGFLYEMANITVEQAHSYLTQNSVPKEVATELVKRIGTRIVHLESSIALLSESKGWCDDEVPINVKLKLFGCSLNAQKLAIEDTQPESGIILAAVSQYGYAEPRMLSKRAQDYEQKENESCNLKIG